MNATTSFYLTRNGNEIVRHRNNYKLSKERAFKKESFQKERNRSPLRIGKFNCAINSLEFCRRVHVCDINTPFSVLDCN